MFVMTAKDEIKSFAFGFGAIFLFLLLATVSFVVAGPFGPIVLLDLLE